MAMLNCCACGGVIEHMHQLRRLDKYPIHAVCLAQIKQVYRECTADDLEEMAASGELLENHKDFTAH